MLDDIEVRTLRVLAAVLRTEHVGRAALELQLTQSTVSYHLARLRDVFSDPLFVRHGRGVRATPRARALGPRVERLLAAAEALRQEEHFDPASLTGELRIASLDFERLAVLTHFAAAVHRVAEGACVALLPRSKRDLEALAEGELELVLGPSTKALPSSYRKRTLYRDHVRIVVARTHSWARRKRGPTLAEYADTPAVSMVVDDTPGNAVDVALARAGLRRRVVARVSGFDSSCALVRETGTVALLPASLTSRAERLGCAVLESPLPLQEFPVQMIWHESRQRDPAHVWLRAMIVQSAAARETRKR